MSMKLNLVDHLLEMGRNYQKAGREREACRILRHLASFRNLPPDRAEETQARLAEMQLKRQRFKRARRHLTAALVYQPDSARYHYLMAQALNVPGRGDPDRAAEHFQRTLELDPNQPKCRAEYGLLLVDLGRVDEGVAALRLALEQAPDDSDVLGLAVEGLCLAERADEARQVMNAARFRQPRDRRIEKVMQDMLYAQLCEEQQAVEPKPPIGDEEPTLLPFAQSTGFRLRVRRDPPQPLPAPRRPRQSFRTRHAP